ncbi:hypothetical protein JXL21_11855 [Candidatus Bathyarchaeota archaeon]|nr:hypothetical protein [Candidatus Bathyarchaeota archaeon]
MNEPHMLILLAAVMAAAHFVTFRLVLDDGFDERFSLYRERQRNQLMRENQEFVSTMQGIIELDPEAVEMTGFGEKWRQKLESIDVVKDKRGKLEGDLHRAYYPAIVSILFSVAALGAPSGVQLPFGYTLYITGFSWWLLLAALLHSLWLLLRYQMVEGELKRTGFPDDSQGIRIGSGENIFSKVLGRIMER